MTRKANLQTGKGCYGLRLFASVQMAASGGNMAEAATGEEFRTGEQLSTTERVIKGGTGLLGAYSVRGRVDEITQGATARVKDVTKPPAGAAEAVTAEGVRVPVSSADDVLSATNVVCHSGSSRCERGCHCRSDNN